MGAEGRCSWNDAKAECNLAKHGLAFDDLSLLFDDRPRFMLLRQDRRRDYGEPRFNALVEYKSLVVNITFTPRAGWFHLISARPASRDERSAYRDAKENDRSKT